MFILLLKEIEKNKFSKILTKMTMRKMKENSGNLQLDSKFPKNMSESGKMLILIMVF